MWSWVVILQLGQEMVLHRLCKGQLGMTWVKMFAKMDVVVEVNDKDVKESACTCYEC